MVTLENKTRRMITLNLTKESAPVHLTRLTKERDRRGAIGTKITKSVVPGSVHIAARGRSKPLGKSALESAEVKAAIASGQVKVHDHGDAEVSPTPTVLEKPSPSPVSSPGFKMSEDDLPSTEARPKGITDGPKSPKKRKK